MTRRKPLTLKKWRPLPLDGHWPLTRRGLLASLLCFTVAVSAAVAQIVQFSGASASSSSNNGWTVFTASSPSGEGDTFNGAGTRLIYVSQSAGSDSNHGTLASPYKTIAKGMANLRTGKPDWMLLKCGDTWTNDPIGDVTVIGKSGSEPMLISSYGSGARPLIRTELTQGAVNGTSTGPDYMAFVDLDLYSYKRDPNNPSFANSGNNNSSNGFSIGSDFGGIDPHWILIEGCKITYYTVNVVFQTRANSQFIGLKRNIIGYAYSNSGGGHSSGVFTQLVTGGTDGLVCQENYYLYNGWDPTATISGGERTVFNHGHYAQDSLTDVSGPATFADNVAIGNSWAGLYPRCGGTVSRCFMDFNATGLSIGYSDANNVPSGAVTSCVVQHSQDCPIGQSVGYGILIEKSDGLTCSGCIVSQSDSPPNAFAIVLNDAGIPAINCTVSNNIGYKTTNGFTNGNPGHGNSFTGNFYDASGANNLGTPEPFTAPLRDILTYDTSLGGPGTRADFVSRVMTDQRKPNWNAALGAPAIINYVRAGFNLVSV